ncbi:hypothetical protein ACJX0J_011517, partial [Zea mays]
MVQLYHGSIIFTEIFFSTGIDVPNGALGNDNKGAQVYMDRRTIQIGISSDLVRIAGLEVAVAALLPVVHHDDADMDNACILEDL